MQPIKYVRLHKSSSGRKVYSSKVCYIKKLERSQMNNLTLYLKILQKEQIKPKVSRKKEIIKIVAEVNRGL